MVIGYGIASGVKVPAPALGYCHIPLVFRTAVFDARKARAIREGIIADARDTKADFDARKALATREGIRADARDAVGNGNARKARAISEGIIADARTARDNDGF